MSSKVYCIAQFRAKPGQQKALFKVLQALEADVYREDGCIQYLVTRQIESGFAGGETEYPIVFNEIWANVAAFEAHCQRPPIQHFFEQQCLAEDGLVEAYNVTAYTDEAEDFQPPQF